MSGVARGEDDRVGAELVALAAELSDVERAWRALVDPLSDGQLNWRPAAGRWSVGEHLAHLSLVDASYLPYLDRMIAAERAAGRAGRAGHGGRARHPRIGRHFVRAVEPPVRLRVRTPASYVPPSALRHAAVLAEFSATQRALQARIETAARLDPARMRARYAVGIGVARLIVLSFGQWLALTAAHDRRHLWLAERVAAMPGFPRTADHGAARSG